MKIKERARLIANCKSERMKRFDKLVEAHIEKIFRVCLFILQEEENAVEKAEEVTIATYIKFYEHMDEVEPEREFVYLVIEARNISHAYKEGIVPKTEVGIDERQMDRTD